MQKEMWALLGLLICTLPGFAAEELAAHRSVAVRDITTVEGIRDNPLLGYGMVVGLNGTGDRAQTLFTTQTLAGILQRMGVQVPAGSMRVNNVAAVMVTATLPPFAVHGTTLDVTVASIGDARSLDGGMLLLTPLYGADGQVYAAAQGPLTLGGYTASSSGNAKQTNHPTVGKISDGGAIERDLSVDLTGLTTISLLLRDPEFVVAQDVSSAINVKVGSGAARAVDSRRIEVTIPKGATVPELLATIQALEVPARTRARIAINERTGTIVMGSDVQLGAVSILHGNLSIEISKTFSVSQPPALSAGETAVTPDTLVNAHDSPAKLIELKEGATVAQLVDGLQKIGATARDVVAILQAMKLAGALQAELEIL
jgi:flagellar P-ring protein precursor FlgI